MAYFEKPFTHGGAGAYREIVNLLISNGWSLLDAATAVNGPATALDSLAVTQTSNLDIRSLPQNALSVDMDLAVAWLRPTIVKREVIAGGGTTVLVEGTDYRIDYRQGTIQALGGGWASNDSERFLISQGDYDLREGWNVFSSSGLSTQENNLFIGLRLVSTGPYNGVDIMGVEWCLFYDFTAGVTDYFSNDQTVRSISSQDVLSLVHPTAPGTIYATFNADKFLGSISVPEAHNAWAYCGALGRTKPVIEQPCVSYMTGSNSHLVGSNLDDGGPVGDVTSRGNTADGVTRGAVWRGDLTTPQFSNAVAAESADLASHFWSKKAEGGPTDIVPSEVEVTKGERYFELHPVACGKDAEELNLGAPDTTFGYLYGTVEDLFAVVKYLVQHRTEVVYLGDTYTILKVGRSITRFIAIRQN